MNSIDTTSPAIRSYNVTLCPTVYGVVLNKTRDQYLWKTCKLYCHQQRNGHVLQNPCL